MREKGKHLDDADERERWLRDLTEAEPKIEQSTIADSAYKRYPGLAATLINALFLSRAPAEYVKDRYLPGIKFTQTAILLYFTSQAHVMWIVDVS